jgi:hypothetical protein
MTFEWLLINAWFGVVYSTKPVFRSTLTHPHFQTIRSQSSPYPRLFCYEIRVVCQYFGKESMHALNGIYLGHLVLKLGLHVKLRLFNGRTICRPILGLLRLSRSAQACLDTYSGYLVTAQIKSLHAQVGKQEWSLVRSLSLLENDAYDSIPNINRMHCKMWSQRPPQVARIAHIHNIITHASLLNENRFFSLYRNTQRDRTVYSIDVGLWKATTRSQIFSAPCSRWCGPQTPMFLVLVTINLTLSGDDLASFPPTQLRVDWCNVKYNLAAENPYGFLLRGDIWAIVKSQQRYTSNEVRWRSYDSYYKQ